MTIITSMFQCKHDDDLTLTIQADDLETDTIAIEIRGERVSMLISDFMLAVEFMERAAESVRRIN